MTPDRKTVRARMRALREERGLTQQQCADALGVAQNTYAEMELGTGRVRPRDLLALSVMYGLTPTDAFPGFAFALPTPAEVP